MTLPLQPIPGGTELVVMAMVAMLWLAIIVLVIRLVVHFFTPTSRVEELERRVGRLDRRVEELEAETGVGTPDRDAEDDGGRAK
ncbi:MAG: hypothetical protein ABEJ42_07900 [Halobacteriaceae archaeon]